MANDPTFETGLHAGTLTLVKADLGIKRICPSCGARFYDLQKRPIECPKCAFSFEPEALYKQRRPRQPEPAPAAVVRVRDEDEETEDEDDETEEAEDGDDGRRKCPPRKRVEDAFDEPGTAGCGGHE